MRKDREKIEKLLLKDPYQKAYDIAAEIGAAEDMERAVNYVRSVRRQMIRKGQIPPSRQATDKERLEDLTALFEKRQGRMSRRAAGYVLLHNCYYRLRSQDDEIHSRAIEYTYDMNEKLLHPLPILEAIRICEIAVDTYMRSIDPEKNEKARRYGFQGAGLHYADRTIKDLWEVKEHELPLIHMR